MHKQIRRWLARAPLAWTGLLVAASRLRLALVTGLARHALLLQPLPR